MKKGQSISMNTIIIAAIALLVLVIVSLIFLTDIFKFTKNKNDCTRNSGTCEFGRRCPEGYSEHPTAFCYDGDEIDSSAVCCVRVS